MKKVCSNRSRNGVTLIEGLLGAAFALMVLMLAITLSSRASRLGVRLETRDGEASFRMSLGDRLRWDLLGARSFQVEGDGQSVSIQGADGIHRYEAGEGWVARDGRHIIGLPRCAVHFSRTCPDLLEVRIETDPGKKVEMSFHLLSSSPRGGQWLPLLSPETASPVPPPASGSRAGP